MSFTKKKIDLTIQLGTGDFGDTLGDTIQLSGLRIDAKLVAFGGETMGMLQARIWGLSLPLMNKLTTVGYVNTALYGQNKIQLVAGDDIQKKLAYKGVITEAWADYSNAPEVVLNITAQSGAIESLKPVEPFSINGSVKIEDAMSFLANEARLGFDNKGVSGFAIVNPYYDGTTWAKIRALAKDANIGATIYLEKLVIYPFLNAKIDNPILVSPETGLIGYPTTSSKGLMFNTLFNNEIVMGGRVNVQVGDSVPMANGLFNVYTVIHSLASEITGGDWFTTASAFPHVQ